MQKQKLIKNFKYTFSLKHPVITVRADWNLNPQFVTKSRTSKQNSAQKQYARSTPVAGATFLSHRLTTHSASKQKQKQKHGNNFKVCTKFYTNNILWPYPFHFSLEHEFLHYNFFFFLDNLVII